MALSSAIAKLEAHLGGRLFNRTTRSVSLTNAGRAFVEKIAPGLEDIRGAMDAARSQQSKPAGMLRINTFAMAAREILAPLVLEYIRRYPDVHVDVVTEGRLVDIVADGFDFGVRMADLVPTDMIGSASTTLAGATPRPLTRHSSHSRAKSRWLRNESVHLPGVCRRKQTHPPTRYHLAGKGDASPPSFYPKAKKAGSRRLRSSFAHPGRTTSNFHAFQSPRSRELLFPALFDDVAVTDDEPLGGSLQHRA
jgi:DNA-binding transcriptional LysR family regulator